jgi:hypothetical protein
MTLPRFTVTQCSWLDEKYQCSQKLQFRQYYLWLFLQVPLSHIPSVQVLEVHLNSIRGITIHITEPKIHVSNSENHDSILFVFVCACPLMISSIPGKSFHFPFPKFVIFFYYFYISPLPTLVHTIAFPISSPFDVTKVQKNCLDVSSTCSFPFPMSVDTHIHIPYHPYCDGDSTLL